VVFTYLTVTEKMIAQAVHLGALDLSPLLHAKRLKRTATFFLALVVFSLLGVTVTGALHWRGRDYAAAHWVATLLAVTIQAGVLYAEYGLIHRNGKLVEETLRGYQIAKAKTRDSARNNHGRKSPNG
jgi:hypothetical protein